MRQWVCDFSEVIDEHTQWFQRIQATLFDHGISGTPEKLCTRDGRALLAALHVAADARERIMVALRMIDALDARSPRSSASWVSSRVASGAVAR